MHRLARYASLAGIALSIGACGDGDLAAPTTMSTRPEANVTGASWVLLLEDDFQRGLDPLKWSTATNIPQGRAKVFADGGHAVLVNRGHLTTVAQFRPKALGGIRISGKWKFLGNGDDFLQILTRSNGFPGPSNPFGETAQGIEFVAFGAGVFEDPNAMYIQGRGHAAGTVTDLLSRGSLVLTTGKTYRFEVVDNGQAMSFTLTDSEDRTRFRTVTARSPYLGESNHVTFHNREYCCLGDHRARLDDVRIERSLQ